MFIKQSFVACKPDDSEGLRPQRCLLQTKFVANFIKFLDDARADIKLSIKFEIDSKPRHHPKNFQFTIRKNPLNNNNVSCIKMYLSLLYSVASRVFYESGLTPLFKSGFSKKFSSNFGEKPSGKSTATGLALRTDV